MLEAGAKSPNHDFVLFMELDEQGGLYARPAPTPRSKMQIRARAQRGPKSQGQSGPPGSTNTTRKPI